MANFVKKKISKPKKKIYVEIQKLRVDRKKMR